STGAFRTAERSVASCRIVEVTVPAEGNRSKLVALNGTEWLINIPSGDCTEAAARSDTITAGCIVCVPSLLTIYRCVSRALRETSDWMPSGKLLKTADHSRSCFSQRD